MRVLRSRLVAAMLLAPAAFIGPAGCADDPADPAASVPEVPVAVQPVRLDTVRDVLTLVGLIVPATATDWTVAATEPGRIVEITKQEGEAVETGEVLVRLELPSVTQEIDAAETKLVEATGRLTEARAELAKLTPLHEKGMISRNMFESAREAAMLAESQVRAAEQARDTAIKLGDRAIIRARFNGVVVKRWHNENDFVAGTQTDGILRIIDPAKVQVSISIPLERFSLVLPGHPATVQVPGADPVPAVVVARQPPTEADTAVAGARLEFVTRQPLPIDSQVQVELVLDERRDVPVVLSSAILRDGDGSAYVMIAGDDGVARRRDVRSGVVAGPVTQILSGVTAGEKVITVGLDNITDGTRISTR